MWTLTVFLGEHKHIIRLNQIYKSKCHRNAQGLEYGLSFVLNNHSINPGEKLPPMHNSIKTTSY